MATVQPPETAGISGAAIFLWIISAFPILGALVDFMEARDARGADVGSYADRAILSLALAAVLIGIGSGIQYLRKIESLLKSRQSAGENGGQP